MDIVQILFLYPNTKDTQHAGRWLSFSVFTKIILHPLFLFIALTFHELAYTVKSHNVKL